MIDSQTGITERFGSILNTAETMSHELGHNLGMMHDFHTDHKGTGTPGKLIQSKLDRYIKTLNTLEPPSKEMAVIGPAFLRMRFFF